MPVVDIVKHADIERTPRVLQLEGLFDIPPSQRSEQAWKVEVPIEADDWNVGVIVGPSGSGKTTVAKELCPGMEEVYSWPADRSIVDGFPAAMGIKEVTGILASVGFSSPPSWLRPFRFLSNGEQFRVTVARALAESKSLTVIDEFTSVVDRTVAQVGSAAVGKAVRRTGKKFIAVTCHYDVIEWLCPDWVLEMPYGTFTRRSLQRRPSIDLDIYRVKISAWELFKRHHYLSSTIGTQAMCFVADWKGKSVAFSSAIHHVGQFFGFREHRTVCLPDYQGVGIGNALSEYVASLFASRGRYYGTTSSASMIHHRNRSPLWAMTRTPKLISDKAEIRTSKLKMGNKGHMSRSNNRLTAGFIYVGPANREAAILHGVCK